VIWVSPAWELSSIVLRSYWNLSVSRLYYMTEDSSRFASYSDALIVRVYWRLSWTSRAESAPTLRISITLINQSLSYTKWCPAFIRVPSAAWSGRDDVIFRFTQWIDITLGGGFNREVIPSYNDERYSSASHCWIITWVRSS
jgi:hypothetical protein